MRILHVALSDEHGGAFKNTRRIHAAHVAAGLDSLFLVRRREAAEASAIGHHQLTAKPHLYYRYQPAADTRLANIGRPKGHSLRSVNIFPTFLAKAIDGYNGDIAILHWIGSGTLSIRDVSRIRTPVAFRLADEWIPSGAKHYSDEGLEQGRSKLRAMDSALDLLTLRRKARLWTPHNLISPSEVQTSVAHLSLLTREWPVVEIPNPVDPSIFWPSLKTPNLEGAPRLLFLSAEPLGSRLKGFDLLSEALMGISYPASSQPLVLTVIAPRDAVIESEVSGRLRGVQLRFVGLQADESVIAEHMRDASLTLVPSRREAFGAVFAESMMCGTPVIAAAGTGCGSWVSRSGSGWTFESGNAESLRRTLLQAFSDLTQNQAHLRLKNAEFAADNFSPLQIVKRYQQLYEDMLER
jgi:glycosyltransferase involved in cell wall biosynthesis